MIVHVYVYENTETTLWFESLVICEGGPLVLVREYDKDIPDPVGPGGTTDYNQLNNKPLINSVTLSGNKTSEQLHIQGELPAGGDTGQVLTKKSAADNDAGWEDPQAGPQGPEGPEGPQGPQGVKGDDGVSPNVTVTPITGGNKVTITDAQGPHEFDVLDGQADSVAWANVTEKPDDLVQDASYVHTDNNFTNAYKAKVDDAAEAVELTQAEYDDLTEAEKKNGKIYFITDGQGGGGYYVDQTYDPTSDRAQSGTAVAEAVANRVKVGGTGAVSGSMGGSKAGKNIDLAVYHEEEAGYNATSYNLRDTGIFGYKRKVSDGTWEEFARFSKDEDTGWQTLTGDYFDIAYRKINNIVYVTWHQTTGVKKAFEAKTPVTNCMLPEGFRPSRNAYTIVVATGTWNYGYAGVQTGGAMRIAFQNAIAQGSETMFGSLSYPV